MTGEHGRPRSLDEVLDQAFPPTFREQLADQAEQARRRFRRLPLHELYAVAAQWSDDDEAATQGLGGVAEKTADDELARRFGPV